ncbi:MAG: methyltransferase domain-containing protein [Sphingobium sp.]|nr:methyltransferase domain-containing protein [Sphingobium sp.]
MADSDHEWRRWGETDPYFGVLADPRFRKDRIEDNRTAFFKLGRLTVEERLATAAKHFGSFERNRALDFGCGVGRLSLPLAAHFDEVLGLDISPAMLAEARTNAERAGIANLTLSRSDEALSAADGSFDFVMSYMVLQHIPVARGMRIVERLLGLVARGGIAAIQFCTARPNDPASRLRYWAQRNVPGVRQAFNLGNGRPAAEPLMQMNAYPLDEVLAMAETAGFKPAIVQPYADGRFEAAQLLMQRG